jgi:mannitol-1-phosphate 5-dehydrogenase
MPDAPHALLFGAGKIARGFLGHLAFRAGYELTFVDADGTLVRLIQRRQTYRVHILGAPWKDETVGPVSAFTPDTLDVAALGARVGVVFVSVGGPNLKHVGPTLSRVLEARSVANGGSLNVIVAENWPDSADELRQSTLADLDGSAVLFVEKCVGFAESTVLRSCIEPTPGQRTEDPLALQCQDYWQLPVDAEALIGGAPRIEGIMPTARFGHALKRKLYTYNAINGAIAYLGFHRGHILLADAAADAVILEHTARVVTEVNATVCAALGYDLDDQVRFAAEALRKFQNHLIVDPIERQVRDPIRKLGRNDRLIGPAMLALEHGMAPVALALSIAAALRYRNLDDPSARRLAGLLEELGVRGTLERVSGIEATSALADLVVSRMDDVERLAHGAPAST